MFALCWIIESVCTNYCHLSSSELSIMNFGRCLQRDAVMPCCAMPLMPLVSERLRGASDQGGLYSLDQIWAMHNYLQLLVQALPFL